MRKPLNLNGEVSNILSKIKALRLSLNKIPELGLKEKKTSLKIKEFLRSFDLRPINVKEAKTGFYLDVLGTKKKTSKDKNYLFRADIDATPFWESPEKLDRKKKCRHLCGHDGHSAILAGAAIVTDRLKDNFSGIRRFIFQPAEEFGDGAELMIKGGVLKKMDAAFALHNFPHPKTGEIILKKGIIIPYTARFNIKIVGRGGHGKTLKERLDASKAFYQILEEVYKIPRRIRSSLKDIATNVYSYSSEGEPVNPEIANLYFCYRMESFEKIKEAVIHLENKILDLKRLGYKISFKKTMGLEGIFNNHSLIKKFGRELDNCNLKYHLVTEPANAGEDFSKYLQKIPGFMFGLTNGSTTPWHSDNYQFNDRIISPGIKSFVAIALSNW